MLKKRDKNFAGKGYTKKWAEINFLFTWNRVEFLKFLKDQRGQELLTGLGGLPDNTLGAGKNSDAKLGGEGY